MTVSLELVHGSISRDTITALEQLLDGARKGEISGLVFGAILKRRRYITDVAGTAFTYPTFARGVAAAIDDELARIIRARGDDETK